MSKTEAQLKTDARQAEVHRCTVEIAKDRARLVSALIEKAGLAGDVAKAIVDEAVERADLPGYEAGDGRLRHARAALDTVAALFLRQWPEADDRPPDPVEVSLALVDHDAGVQVRVAGTDADVVDNYAARMRAGDAFPPLVLFFDPDEEANDWHLWLADGFHRFEAAEQMSLVSPTHPAVIYAGTRGDAEEYAATCNARHGLPLSNEDKRAAVRRLLDLHPEWSDREIARRVGVSHPTVGKVRRTMAAVCGKDDVRKRDRPDQRVVQRGGQTYTYTPPEPRDIPDPVPVWKLERGVYKYLGESYQHDDVAGRIAEVEDIRHHRDYERITDHLAGPRRKRDLEQALNNVLEQLRQRIEGDGAASYQPLPVAQTESSPVSAGDALPPPGADGRQRIRDALLSGHWRELRHLVARHPSAAFMSALRMTFALGDYADWVAATDCLIEALGLLGEGDEGACPDCGGRMVHISANGKPARNVCIVCGAVVEIEETKL